MVSCSDPGARSTLGPVTEGLVIPPPTGWDESWSYGTGVAVGDLNGDALLDILLPGPLSLQVMIQQQDGSFAELLDSFQAAQPHLAYVASLIDLDADRDLDAVVSHDEKGSVVYLNDGAARFAPQTATGLEGSALYARGFFWGDMDGDGDLDISIANDRNQTKPPEPGEDNELFERSGPLTWTNVSERLLEEWRNGYTKLTPWLDADGDGVMDLYVINHMPLFSGNHLLRNDGDGRFTAWPEPGLDIEISGMGFDQADINGDGVPDLLMSNIAHINVMSSDGAGGWYQADAALGIQVREEDIRSAS